MLRTRPFLAVLLLVAFVATAAPAPADAAPRGCPSKGYRTVAAYKGVKVIAPKSRTVGGSAFVCRRGSGRPVRVESQSHDRILAVAGDWALYMTWYETPPEFVGEGEPDVDLTWDVSAIDLEHRRARTVAELSGTIGRASVHLDARGRVLYVGNEGELILDAVGGDEVLDRPAKAGAGRLRVSGRGPREVARYDGRTVRVAERRARLRRCFGESEFFAQVDGGGFLARRGAAQITACPIAAGRPVVISRTCEDFDPAWRGRWLFWACGARRRAIGVADMAGAGVLLDAPVVATANTVDEGASSIAASDFGAIAWTDRVPAPGDPAPPEVLKVFVPGTAAPVTLDSAYDLYGAFFTGRTLQWRRQTRANGPVVLRRQTFTG